MSDGGALNRRKFERVPLKLDWGPAQALVGAEWHWPNHEVGAVFDLSYQGLAVARPSLQEMKVDMALAGELRLGPFPAFKVSVRVAWLGPSVIGLEMNAVSLLARQSIDKFLRDQIVGRHLTKVDPQFYSGRESFSVWYHGPRETNVYLWRGERGKITRAEVQIGEDVLIVDAGVVTPADDRERLRRVMALLSQIDEPHELVKELLNALAKERP